MKVLNYTGLQNLWTNIKNYITVHTPTKTSDLTNDSNFVDTSNSAVASGITSAKVTSYDSHLANTDIHVTAADKTKWNTGVSQAYVFRYSGTAITDNSTIAYSTLDNTDNIKASDKIIDTDGKIFSIVSVDSDNSTVTVGSALIDLALDANVMHLSGNETVEGQKKFNDLQIIEYGTQYKGARNAYILPEFSAGYSGLSITTLSFSQTLKIGSFVLDSNNKPTLDTSKAYIQVATGESNSVNTCVFEPRNSTNSTLGTSSNKWKEINGLTPSSLSLPNYSQRLDISGYITDLTGGNNIYTPIANGYIYLRTDSGLMLEILDVTSGVGSSSIVPSNDKLKIFLPVVAQRNVYIKAKCTSLVSAVLVPCFGNI